MSHFQHLPRALSFNGGLSAVSWRMVKREAFEVTFRPTSSAFQRATLTVTSTAPGSPHSIGLIGKGPGGF